MADLMHDFDVVSRWENDIWDNMTVCLNFISRRQRKYLFDISHMYALNTSHFSSSSLNPYNNIYVQDKLDDWQLEMPVSRPDYRPHLGHSHPDPNINQTKGRYLGRRQAPLRSPQQRLVTFKSFLLYLMGHSTLANPIKFASAWVIRAILKRLPPRSDESISVQVLGF